MATASGIAPVLAVAITGCGGKEASPDDASSADARTADTVAAVASADAATAAPETVEPSDTAGVEDAPDSGDPSDVQEVGPQDAAAQETAASLPTAATASASCKDKRQRGDKIASWDGCWDPPAHYCSAGFNAMLWFGCSPDEKICFAFDAGCHPCGWTPCPIRPKDKPPSKLPPGCPTWLPYPFYFASVPKEVLPYWPDEKKKFCWDGAPPEWSTPGFHLKDAGPPMP